MSSPTEPRGTTPAVRIRVRRDRPPRPAGRYVLYWMIAARRSSWNFALDRAVDWARALGQPLLVLEALRCDYRWASDRLHRFVLDGMHDNQVACAAMGIGYYPYIEPQPRAGHGLLQALTGDASVVVTDRAPVFDVPRLVTAAARRLDARFEEVDGNGVLPLDDPPKGVVFPTAYAYRRYLQRRLADHLLVRPRAVSVSRGDLPAPRPIPDEVVARWPPADVGRVREELSALPIDHRVAPVATAGGTTAGRQRCEAFVERDLARYGEDRNHPDDEVCSGLSPYLHFGHISSHEVVARVLDRGGWTPERIAHTVNGSKTGWWGLAPAHEAFLDQIVTWRELGFNMADRRADFDRYDALPAWAIATLERHASDPRPHTYSLDQFSSARTHDPVWNAAQRQLVTEGRIHNYLRMLWGKKILEWTDTPRQALDVMIELNNRWALDGRDPNSYSGIFWVLGRYDRPWPERPIFGTVRYMTSDSTVRKLRIREYLRRYGTSLLAGL